jgi:hypothetical protein
MEPKLRGVIEKMLDQMLTSEHLEDMSEVYELYKPFVKSKEDTMFGDIVGSMTERFISFIMDFDRRKPTDAEMKEFLDIIDRRAQEIKSKILMLTSR